MVPNALRTAREGIEPNRNGPEFHPSGSFRRLLFCRVYGLPRTSLMWRLVNRRGRVSSRMALDHPQNVERLAVFDAIPILEAWSRSRARFAQTYWQWILLS